jgi:phosphocarrier protein HPr
MIKTTYIVKSQEGIHARPASNLVRAAAKSLGKVEIIFANKQVTLKSMLMVLSLGIPCGAEFSILIEGGKEEEVKQSLEAILIEEQII